MLPLIDARTIFVATAVVFGGLLVSVVLAWRELGKLKGPERFAASYVSFFAGLVLFALRGRIPDLLSITLSNSLFVLGAALVLEGTRVFYGLRPNRRLTVAATVAAVAIFGWLTAFRVESAPRTILSSASLAGFLGASAWTIWHRRPRGGSQALEKVTAVALGTCALLFWARGVAVGARIVDRELDWESPWMALPPLLCTLCAVVWTTALLANTSRRLMAVVRSQNELLASLIAVSRAAGSASSLDVTLERVLEATCALTGATGASLLLLDEQGRFSRGIFAEGSSSIPIRRSEAREILDKGLAGWVVRTRQSVLVPDVEREPRWHRLPSQEGWGLRSALSAPIENGPELYGVLTLVHREPEHFGEDQRQLLESTTAQIALAIRTAQLDDARIRATRSQELVNAVLAVSARAKDADRLVSEAAETISRGSMLPRVYLAIPGEDGHFRLAGRTAGLENLRPRLDEGLLGRAFVSGRTTRERAPGDVDETGGHAVWSRLAVPLLHLGRTLGVAAFEIRGPRSFDGEDVALAEALAEAVSLGLGKAAEARAREELTRMMVHDLRGPISGVMGALELLADGRDLAEPDQKLLASAERSVQRQLTLIEGILELARLEDGALPVRPEEVTPHRLLDEVLRTLQPAAAARGIAIEAVVPQDLPGVLADFGLVSRVLENLVGNAVKFSEPGTGPVRVSASLDGCAVEVRVRDSGPGVEEAVRPRLFEKFTVGRLPGRGSGLGLAFCRLAVEAQGGRIWLDHPGPGAVFAFSLPLAGRPEA